MKYLVSLFILCFLGVFHPGLVAAHGPGMLPFVEVDGRYTLFNPTYQSGITLNSAQDLAGDRYRVDTPVSFSVDRSRLPFPSQLSTQFSFRWSFYQGNNFEKQVGGYFLGNEVTHIFTSSGSHLVKLEIKVPNSPSFAVLDTVMVNVFPTRSYVYPKASMDMQTSNTGVIFMAKATIDPMVHHVTYLWDLGDGRLGSGNKVEATIQFINNFPKKGVTARIIDDHGFITDIFLRQETFTRQIDYDTVIYVNNVVTTQFGTVTNTVLHGSSDSAGKQLILALPINSFMQNMFFVFLSIAGLLIVRFMLSFYE